MTDEELAIFPLHPWSAFRRNKEPSAERRAHIGVGISQAGGVRRDQT